MRLDEAGQDFQKAVEADPRSAKAHLSLGVIYLFRYQNGVGKPVDLPDDYLNRIKKLPPGSPPPALPPRSLLGRSPNRIAQISGQNSTNGAMAEEYLKKALELEPLNEQSMEYLGALYFWWRDPATENWARRDDARRWYARLLEINPRHRFANYVCGVIDFDSSFKIIRSTPGFPRPLANDESGRSLRAKVDPLLKVSAQNFLRSLEIDPANSDAMIYLGYVRSDEAYIAESPHESARLRTEATDWYDKADQTKEAHAKTTGQPWPPGEKATATFVRVPGRAAPIPAFPPDSRLMIPPAPLPPPPPPPLPPDFRR